MLFTALLFILILPIIFIWKRRSNLRFLFIILPILIVSISTIALVRAQSGPTLTITKDFGGSSSIEVESGEPFTYYIAYRCASAIDDCINATLTDTLPAEVEYIDISAPPNDVQNINYDSGSHTVVVDFFDPLGAGKTGIIEITVQFPPGTLPGTTAVNNATSSTDGGTENAGPATATASGAYEMFIDKTVNGDADDGVVGSEFTTNYTLQVCNPDDKGGVRLTNPVITDTLPLEATFVSATNGGVYNPGSHTIRWDNATLPDPVPVVDGCSITLGVQVQFLPDGPDGIPGNSDDADINDLVTNSMNLTGTPEDGTPDIDLDDSVDLTLIGPYFSDSSGKSASSPSTYTARPVEELAGGIVNYSVSYNNTGTITATNVTITDVVPMDVTVTSIQIGPAENPTDGYYRTVNNPATWLPFPDNSYAALTTVPVTDTTTANPNDIELAPGDSIAGIRWEIGTVGYGSSWSANVGTFIDPTVSTGTTFNNCITITADYDDGTPGSTNHNNCAAVTVIETRAIPRIDKTTSSGSLLPGEVTLYTIEVYNADVAHNNVVAPITVGDLLPDRLEVVLPDAGEPTGYRVPNATEITNGDWYTFSATDSAPNPTHTFTTSFNAENDTLLRWNFAAPYEQAPGERITLTFFARVLDYTVPQQLDNNGIVLWDDAGTDNALLCDASDGNNSYTDADDIDGDADTTELGCQITEPLEVRAFLSLDSQKFVQGNDQTGWKDYDVTISGGAVDYRLAITNTSNVSATNIIVYDIFPYLGDSGVIDTSARESEWAPHLIAPITDTQGLPMIIAYSQSTNPCRPEVIPSGPSGCTDDWSTTPPADITSVRALRFDMCDGTCLELPPDDGSGGGSFQFNWHMVAPNSAVVGEVAWNSFGFTAEGGGLTLLPSEPIRVGIEVEPNTLPGYSIGDYVWLDLAGEQDDGIQQPEETGLSGVRVELWDANTNTFLDYRTTGPDANLDPGYYEFINIPNGNYFIRFFKPQYGGPYTFSPGNQGGDDTADSDGVTLGTDAMHGDYIQTDDFTILLADNYDIDQGMWIEADYGDAPATYPVEAATQANPADAARHIIVSGISLGSTIDDETDGQPDIDALGDDLTIDDEDGVAFDQYIGTTASPTAIMLIGEDNDITISPVISSPFTTTTSGYLNMWLDLNGDGDWDDPGEQIADDVVVNHGVPENLTVSVPTTAVPGRTYARFRLSTQPGLTPTGMAIDGEVEDYHVQLINPPNKMIVATSEAHTDANQAAIGEIVRYHLQVPILEGDSANFVIEDNLPNGLLFLDDGSATVGMTATTTITWSQFTITGGPFNSGRNPLFNLGTVTNNDQDSGEEFLFVEFNALVLNDNSNDAGDRRNNNFTVTYDTFTDTSPNTEIRIVEPNIDLTKTITSTPTDAGDTAVYQLTATNNTGTYIESGFDVSITDTLDSNLSLQAIQINAPGYAAITDTSNIPANQLNIIANQLDPGDSITVILTATVNSTAPAGQSITNTGYLLYSSLPLTGTVGNPTGSVIPGGSGDNNGERDGSGSQNDHADTAVVSSQLDTPTITKTVSPTNYTIGESVTFNLLVTLPEGTTLDLEVIDDLPAGLDYQSHQIITTAAGSGGLLTADFGGTLPSPTVTAPGGNGVNAIFDFGDTTTTNDNDPANNRFLIQVTAVVLNVLTNQNNVDLTNTADLNYTDDGVTVTEQDTAVITVIEPILQINKSLQSPIPSPIDAGTIITYNIVLSHTTSSNADAFDLVLTDTLPVELINPSIESVTASGITAPAVDLTGNTITAPTSGTFDFTQGAVLTITVSGEVDITAVPNQPITNTAGVVWSTLDGSPAIERDGGAGTPDGIDPLDGGALDDYETSGSVTFTVDQVAFTKALIDTSAAHTAGLDVTIGEIITYSLSINLPEGTIPSLELVDDIPDGMRFITGTVQFDYSNYNGVVPTPTITSSLGSGDDVTITYPSFTVPNDNDPTNNAFTVLLQAVVMDEPGNVGHNPPGQTQLTNNATIQIGSNTPVPAPPVAVDVVEPQLIIQKSFNTAAATPNETVTVTLTVTNTGLSTAFDMIIDDPIDNAEFINITEDFTAAGFSYTAVPSGGDTIVRYDGGSLAPGGTVTFTFQATLAGDLPPSPPDLINVATVTQATTLDSTADDGNDGEERDEPDVNDSDNLTVLIPDIVLSKTDNQTLVNPGQQITYTLTISNVGGITATGVVITETVPANTIFAGTAGWSCLPDGSAGSTCTYTLGTLANSASTTVDYSVIIDDPLPNFTSVITNTAVAADDHTQGNDPTPANNSDSDSSTVTASIGNFIWTDTNGNGIQDGGELGLDNVTVILYDITNTPIMTTSTAGDGSYSFINLPPADYYLEIVPPANHTITQLDEGGDDTADSDFNPATNQTITTTLSPGENDTSWDGGLYIPASIGDFVWYDMNNNGIQDGSPEIGLYGITVTLYLSGTGAISTTTTDASGFYSFTNLAPDSYFIEVTPPAGYTHSPQDQGGSDLADSDINSGTSQSIPTVLISGENDPTWDAGLYAPPASLGDYVWLDANQDGDQDPDEYGIPDVTVALYDYDGNLISTTTTTDFGLYSFVNIPPGEVYIEVSPPAGYTVTNPDLGGDDALDSDINTGTNQSNLTTLDPNETDNTLDAGLYIAPATIGDFVWLDANQDGDQDPDEYGIFGATVELYDDNDNLLAATTTDANGAYSFTNLPPGDYYLIFPTPGGYSTVLDDQGGNDTADSDYDPANGRTPTTSLSGGQTDNSWDAGFYIPPATIGNYIWLDANQDGIQDGNEQGIGGVTVELYDNNSDLVGTTTTDGNGRYQFTNLPPNTYYIDVTPPISYTITTVDVGGDDSRDSDIDQGSGQTITTTLSTGETDLTWDGGLYIPPASLGDYVWLDADQDGIQDAGEYGIPNVTVALYDSSGLFITSTTTSATGIYSFTNIVPGDYYIDVTPPVSYTITTPDLGGNDAFDSDISITTGQSITTTLLSNENDPTWDAGLFVPPASVGNFVWLDANQDGDQDNDELGIGGVTVELYDSSGNLIDTTTTDGNGAYQFSNLPPGDYQITIVPPAGYAIVTADQGGDDNLDSDINGSGSTPTFTLASGQTDNSWDGGLYVPPASLGDFVWLDADQNGAQDSGEFGIPNVVVNLYDLSNTLVATTTTDSLGGYGFSNLPPTDYIVEIIPPAAYTITTQNSVTDTIDSDIAVGNGRTDTITLSSGQDDPTVDGGLYTAPASLGNFIWLDADQDGEQDNDELGIENVTVDLYASDGTLLDTTTTDANGGYNFVNLPPGGYYIDVTPPAGYTIVAKDNIANDTADSDIDPTTGESDPTILVSGENDTSWDGGLYILPASLGDYVWLDADLNGIQDNDESGFVGAIVNLYNANDILIDVTTTITNGAYSFTNLPPGDYYVEVELPPNHIFTDQDQGANDGLDSDVDVTNGRMPTLTLNAGDNDPNWDAGLIPAVARIGDLVWHDLDGDGLQNVGEPGIGGITVTLYLSGTGAISTTVTNSSGFYDFDRLGPGDYYVEFDLPAGFEFTQQDQGSDDTADSDVNPANGQTVVTQLTNGENDTSWDAGLVQPLNPGLAAIGDTVWEDLDSDGIRDVGEPGISGITVTLHLSGTGAISTTVTGANGLYQFTDLPPDSYFVEFTLPVGFDFTQLDQGSNDAADSDADPGTGQTIPTDLTAGENDTSWDAGLVQQLSPTLAAIGNFIWHDSNRDGIQDIGESGLVGVTVNLYDGNGVLTDTTTTDANGLYQFTDLAPGDYFIEAIPPSGYVISLQDQGGDDTADSDAEDSPFSPAYGQTISTTLTAGENDTSWDVGMYMPSAPTTASIGDFVWEDLNADGIRDLGESGVMSVTVRLLDSLGSLVDTATTDAAGFYQFTDLLPGEYVVEFVPPTGYVLTYPDASGNDLDDSDADPLTGRTITTTLTAGENDPSWDAGLYQPVRLGNRVWNDTNNDGQYDGLTEPSLANVVLELLDGSGNPILAPGTGLPITTTTTVSGTYAFEGIPEGTYIVRVAAANFDDWDNPLYGFVSSLNEQATDPAMDADVDDSDDDDNGRNQLDPAATGVESFPVTVTLGGEPTTDGADEDNVYADNNSNLTLDFGFFELLTLGNYIWFDDNQDGVIDPQEASVSGVVVNLLDLTGAPVLHPVSGLPVTTTTNAQGFYQFTNLYPGDYIIEVAASNFQIGAPLANYWSSEGFVDPDNDVDVDDNGVDEDEPWITGIRSQPVRLDYNTEPDGFIDSDDNNNTNLTIDFGFVAVPTAVTLTSFTATHVGGIQVRIDWETESEVDSFGFRIYRSSTNAFGSASEIHFEPTAVSGGTGPGAAYSFTDQNAPMGTVYYWLVDVETDGDTAVHGPRSVTVSAGHVIYLSVMIRP